MIRVRGAYLCILVAACGPIDHRFGTSSSPPELLRRFSFEGGSDGTMIRQGAVYGDDDPIDVLGRHDSGTLSFDGSRAAVGAQSGVLATTGLGGGSWFRWRLPATNALAARFFLYLEAWPPAGQKMLLSVAHADGEPRGGLRIDDSGVLELVNGSFTTDHAGGVQIPLATWVRTELRWSLTGADVLQARLFVSDPYGTVADEQLGGPLAEDAGEDANEILFGFFTGQTPLIGNLDEVGVAEDWIGPPAH